MQKYNATEAKELKLKENRAYQVHPNVKAVWSELKALLLGEAIVVKYSEWPLKNRPSQSSLPKQVTDGGKKFSVRNLEDDSAFVLIRVG